MDGKSNNRLHNMPNILTVGSILGGAILRWYWIFLVYRPSENLYSDMGGYASNARLILDTTHRLHEFDLVQGPGTALLLALSLKLTGSFQLGDWMWWLMSSVTPLVWGAIAGALPLGSINPRQQKWLAAIATFFTAFDLSHAAMASAFMPATPFTLIIAIGILLLLVAFKADKPPIRSIASIGSGILWSLSMLFRGHGIVMLGTLMALVLFAVFNYAGHWARRNNQAHASADEKSSFRELKSSPPIIALLAMVITMLATGSYIHGKTGRFTTSSLNGAANILIGHLPDATAVKFLPTDVPAEHHFGSVAVNERMPTKTYKFYFSVIDSKKALKEAVTMFQNDPATFVLNSFQNAWYTFGGSLPWPASHMPIRHLIRLYESFFILFAFFPALAGLALTSTHGPSGRHAAILLGMPLVGIWLLSFVVVGEARYRIPFDGIILLFSATLWQSIWIRIFKIKADS